MELAMGPTGVSSARNPKNILSDTYQRTFSGDTIGLQLTASTSFSPNKHLKGTNQTGQNFTVDEAIVLVSE